MIANIIDRTAFIDGSWVEPGSRILKEHYSRRRRTAGSIWRDEAVQLVLPRAGPSGD